MTHRHVFKLIEDGPDCDECLYVATIAIAKCECGAQIGPTAIEMALNAVQCLSAEDARAVAKIPELELLSWYQDLEDKLVAYARALGSIMGNLRY